MFKSKIYRALEGKHIKKRKTNKKKKTTILHSANEREKSGTAYPDVEEIEINKYLGLEQATVQPPRPKRASAPNNRAGNSRSIRENQNLTASNSAKKESAREIAIFGEMGERSIIPYKSPEFSGLQKTTVENDQDETGNGVLPDSLIQPTDQKSIWNEKKFPSKTRPISFSPQKLYNALVEYSNTTLDLAKTLDNHKIETNTFWKLARDYPEISASYLAARRHKAHQYGAAALHIWEQIPDNPMFYQADRFGNMSLTSAAVRYMEVKSAQYHRFAQIHETNSYVPVSKQETVNKNLTFGVTFKGKLPQGFDLSTASPAELVDLIKGKNPENRQ